MKSLRFHLLPILFILFFAMWGINDLFGPGLYTAHDIWHQTARLYHYSDNLAAGQILPMWVSKLARGYGYPLFIFSYHLPWMIGAPFVLLGLPLFNVLKGLFGFAFIFSGYAFYLFVYRVFKSRIAATVGAMTYMWAPSHFLALYVSASIGITFVFALVPLMALGLWLYLVEKKFLVGAFLFSVAVVAAILSHLITAVMVFPFVMIWGVLLAITFEPIGFRTMFRHVQFLIVSGAFSLGMAAFYLIPFLAYLPYTKANEASGGLKGLYEKYFPTFKQLIYSRWGYGPIVDRASDGEISMQVGVVQWMAVALSVLLITFLLVKTPRSRKQLAVGISSLVGFILTIFFLLELSKPIWKFVDSVISLDYPFRLLLAAVFFGSILVSWVLANISVKAVKAIIALGFVIVAWYTNRNHIHVNLYTDFSLETYLAVEVTTNSFHEYAVKGTNFDDLLEVGPVAMTEGDFIRPPSKDDPAKPRLSTSNEKVDGGGFSFTLDLPEEKNVSLRQFVFPGVKTFVNGEEASYKSGSNGLLTLHLQTGKYDIEVSFFRLWWVKLSYLLSAITIVMMITLLVFRNKKLFMIK